MIGNYKEYINHLNAAHRAIASGYASAIENYNRQKKNFKNILGIETQQAEKEFLEKLNNEITNETDEELETTFDQAFSAVQNDVESLLANMIDGKNNTDYRTLVKRFKDLVKRGIGLAKPVIEKAGKAVKEVAKKGAELVKPAVAYVKNGAGKVVNYVKNLVK